jgi:hypothetical protein
MHHLTDEQIVDTAEGLADRAVSVHLSGCAACRARVAETRAVLDAVTSVPAADPSPLFWEHFAARVNAAIDAPASSRSRLAGRLAWLGATAILLITLGLAAARWPAGLPGHETPTPLATTQGSPPGASDPFPGAPRLDGSLEDDAAWAVVQSMAGDLSYDDVLEAGVLPRPGSIERAATELSPEERAELVRLIQDELKRTGA